MASAMIVQRTNRDRSRRAATAAARIGMARIWVSDAVSIPDCCVVPKCGGVLPDHQEDQVQRGDHQEARE
jgi:hypothetical protein